MTDHSLTERMRVHANRDDTSDTLMELLLIGATTIDRLSEVNVENVSVEEDRAAREAQEILDHKALRDRFAIAALPQVMGAVGGSTPPEKVPTVCAVAAYKFADAMIVERDR